MLKMKCPKCAEMIISALLADMERVPCDHCKEIVPVTNVMVFAEGFTFHRNDLIKRLFRYKTLLDEILKERQVMEKNPQVSEESKRSLDNFANALSEVMAGARNNLRVDFAEMVTLRYRMGSRIESGKLCNLSMSGACIEITDNAVCPKRKSALAIDFSLPGIDFAFTLPGTVSWVKKGRSFGLAFDTLEPQAVDTLWNFITAAVEN